MILKQHCFGHMICTYAQMMLAYIITMATSGNSKFHTLRLQTIPHDLV